MENGRKSSAMTDDEVLRWKGRSFGSYTWRYTATDLILYALGIGFGAADPQYIYERHPNFTYFPTFLTIPSTRALDAVPLPWARVLHGEHALHIHNIIVPSGIFLSRVHVSDVQNKGRTGMLIVIKIDTFAVPDDISPEDFSTRTAPENESETVPPPGLLVATNIMTFILRRPKPQPLTSTRDPPDQPTTSHSGSILAPTKTQSTNQGISSLASTTTQGTNQSGAIVAPATQRRAPAAKRPPADSALALEQAVHVVAHVTRPDAAVLYRLSGDRNSLHVDPLVAAKLGYPRPILHGLCVLGHAARAVVSKCCGGDSARLRSIACRFARHVFPGDALHTALFRATPASASPAADGSQHASFSCFVSRDDRCEQVLLRGVATVADDRPVGRARL